jgi:hypothetical protein
MDSFKPPVEERIRNSEKEVTTRALIARIKELEKELDEIRIKPPQKQEETISHRLQTYRPLPMTISATGKFVLSGLSVLLILFLALATRWCLAA